MSHIIVGESNDLTQNQKDILNDLRMNPAVAAKVILGANLHWYQVKTIEDFFCNQKRFALYKWSRQLGKCQSKNSLILVKLQRFCEPKFEVKYITIEELFDLKNKRNDIKDIFILTLSQDSLKFEETNNFNVTKNGKKSCFKVKTASGRDTSPTSNHPLLTISGWVKVEDIKQGMKIAVPRIIPFFNQDDALSDDDVKLIAYMIGDGCVRKGKNNINFNLTNAIDKVIEEWKYCCNYAFGNDSEFYVYRDIQWFLSFNNLNKPLVYNFLDKYKLLGKLSYDKRVPQQIFGTSKRQIALFLSRLFATDGWASINYHKVSKVDSKERYSGEIGYCSVNERLVKDIQHLLLRFGIISSYRRKEVDYIRKNGEQSIAYQLHIGDSRSIITFCDEIGIFGKEEAVAEVRALVESKENNNNRDVIPIEIWEYISKKVNEKLVIEKAKQKAWLKETGNRIDRGEFESLRKWDREGKIRRKELTPGYPYAPQREKVLKYAEFLNDDFLRGLATSDLYWDEVVSVEYDGEHETYDLAVPGPDNGGIDGKYRNFIADDILVHNTFLESVTVGLQCILYPGEVGIFIAPSQRQSLNPMNNLIRFYNDNEFLRGLVSKKTKGFMRFKNGSEITCLPMGDGSKVLGTHATILGIDEYARFSQEYITTIILPMLNQPGANGLPNKLVTLSTPLSKQNHFYSWYLTHKKHAANPGSLYSLSEYDYRDSPTIDLDIIRLQYENSSWEQFARENLGIFTDNLDGYFPNELIYSCDEEEPGSIVVQNSPISIDARYVLGVDPSNMVMQDRFAIYLYQVIEEPERGIGLQFANAWVFDSKTIPEVEALLRRIMRVFPVIRCNIDAGGGGRQIAEHLMEPVVYVDNILGEEMVWSGCKNAEVSDKTPQHGGSETPIRIIPYSSEKKNRMFFNLKNLMSKGLFKLPKTNFYDKRYVESNLLKDELENITTRSLPNNLLSFDHPENVGDDRVNATALAVDAMWDVFYGTTESSANMVRGIPRKFNESIGDLFGKRDVNFNNRELLIGDRR